MKTITPQHEWQWQLFVLLLKEAAKDKGISMYKIAQKTGYPQSTIGRIFKLEVSPRLQTVLDIAKVLEIKFITK